MEHIIRWLLIKMVFSGFVFKMIPHQIRKFHTTLIDENGLLWVCVYNIYGQFGLCHHSDQNSLDQVQIIKKHRINTTGSYL